MSLYLGPLGGLRAIRPLKNVAMSPQRFGGVHESLTGRRTVDYLGARSTFELSWRALPPEGELAWLRACYYRHAPGPLRLLLEDVHRNRLSQSAAALGYGGTDQSGVRANTGALAPSTLWPADAAPPGRGLSWRGGKADDGIVLDAEQPPPILPGETVTGSIYVRSPVADAVGVTLTHVTPDGIGSTGAGSDVVTLTPDTWTRISATTTPSVDAPDVDVIAAHLALIVSAPAGDSAELVAAAAQVEPGEVATAWQLGGGAPLVAVDELTLESPFAPYTRPSMTLLEL